MYLAHEHIEALGIQSHFMVSLVGDRLIDPFSGRRIRRPNQAGDGVEALHTRRTSTIRVGPFSDLV